MIIWYKLLFLLYHILVSSFCLKNTENNGSYHLVSHLVPSSMYCKYVCSTPHQKVNSVKTWMSSKKLKMNDNKIEVIPIASANQLKRVPSSIFFPFSGTAFVELIFVPCIRREKFSRRSFFSGSTVWNSLPLCLQTV